jgi:hypothetical protein
MEPRLGHIRPLALLAALLACAAILALPGRAHAASIGTVYADDNGSVQLEIDPRTPAPAGHGGGASALPFTVYDLEMLLAGGLLLAGLGVYFRYATSEPVRVVSPDSGLRSRDLSY